MGTKSERIKTKRSKLPLVVGIDEAGRGPLAGPVAVGLVLIKNHNPLFWRELLNLLGGRVLDSKQLTEGEREAIYKQLLKLQKSGNLEIQNSLIAAKVINDKGISFALKQGIAKNLQKLNQLPQNLYILLDGSLKASTQFPKQKTIIKGDEKELPIALASIVAKVARDRYMRRLHKKYPHYGFDQHKGYGTAFHLAALKKHGLTKEHRLWGTFRANPPPVLAK